MILSPPTPPPPPPPTPVRRSRNHHSQTFQTPVARTDIYKGQFFPQTISDWNALPDSIITSVEGAEDGVARFTSLVRALPLWWELRTIFPYHRSWWMNVIRRITSKNSESADSEENKCGPLMHLGTIPFIFREHSHFWVNKWTFT